jgi:AcrR family transcriptional regulator
MASPSKKPIRRSIREEQKRFTRERLLDAAIEIFEQVGFREATIDQITLAAGANRTTFYLHFSDKLDLARELATRTMALCSSLYTELGKMYDPSLAEVHNWLERMFLLRQQHKVLFDVAHEASINDSAVKHLQMQFHRARIHEYFQPLFKHHLPEVKDILVTRIMLLNLMYDRYFFLDEFEGNNALSVKPILNEVANMWLSGVLSKTPANIKLEDKN